MLYNKTTYRWIIVIQTSTNFHRRLAQVSWRFNCVFAIFNAYAARLRNAFWGVYFQNLNARFPIKSTVAFKELVSVHNAMKVTLKPNRLKYCTEMEMYKDWSKSNKNFCFSKIIYPSRFICCPLNIVTLPFSVFCNLQQTFLVYLWEPTFCF